MAIQVKSREDDASQVKKGDTPEIESSDLPGKVIPDFGNMKDYWGGLLDKRRETSERAIIDIKISTKQIDPLMNEALARAHKKMATVTDENELIHLINKKGWTTEIDRVTKRLNRLRLSDARKRILDISYVTILSRLLSNATPNAEVKDEVGFTDAVLYELERDNGPLDIVADILVNIVSKRNRIEMEPDSIMAGLVAQQLRANF